MIRIETMQRSLASVEALGECIVFPPALAGPEYMRGVVDAMPPGIAVRGVCAPGRGSLADRNPRYRVAELVRCVSDFIATRSVPTVLLGHSLGAMHALAVAHRVEACTDSEIAAVLISGADAPGKAVRKMAPAELLNASGLLSLSADNHLGPHLQEMAATDLTVGQVLRRALKSVRLSTPIDVFVGAADPFVQPHVLDDWKVHTDVCRITTLPGAHDFVTAPSNAAAIAAAVHSYLFRLGALTHE